MLGGKDGVEGWRIEEVVGVDVIEAERRRCFAVAVRTARGGVRLEEGGVRIGVRKAVVGVGRERVVREAVRWWIVSCWFCAIAMGGCSWIVGVEVYKTKKIAALLHSSASRRSSC